MTTLYHDIVWAYFIEYPLLHTDKYTFNCL